MSATPRHRVRLSVHRLLRADEMATVLREVLSAIASNAAQAIAFGEWGDMLIETASGTSKPDLQGLGEIAYRLLTGHLPTPGTRYVPGAPPPLATLILHMLGDAAARPTVRDAEMAIAVMLGEVVTVDSAMDEPPVLPEPPGTFDPLAVGTVRPGKAFEVLDSFDDDEEATSQSLAEDVPPPPRPAATPMPAATEPASDSQPNLRRLRWTPPTHLAPAARAALLPPTKRKQPT